MKALATLAAFGLLAAAPALAADVAAGEKTFGQCRACHMIADGDNVIYKGGKVGPNLYGVIGRKAGSLDGFRYGDSLVQAGEGGLVWDEAAVAVYVQDPKAFLVKATGDAKAKSKMAFKLRKNAEDVAAYLASVGGGS